jgi:hypothetical protein
MLGMPEIILNLKCCVSYPVTIAGCQWILLFLIKDVTTMCEGTVVITGIHLQKRLPIFLELINGD